MVNNNNNGKEKTVDIPERTANRLANYIADTGKSESKFVNEALNNEITRCEVKNLLSEECNEGGRLPVDSKLCKHLARNGDHHSL